MEKYQSQDFQDIADDIYDLIVDFLAHPSQYYTDAVVAIDKGTRKVILESPRRLTDNYTQFPLADFILMGCEASLFEPDTTFIYGEKGRPSRG